ncbi:MAG: tRNA lysidine(34) synthetase TilS, partial [Bacteroidota bacterium]
TAKTIYVDKEKLNYPLLIRKWKNGDYFYPLGMSGKKKLSKYFKDEKVDVFAKQEQWLLTSNGEIVWIIGRRMDRRFQVTENTKAILKIELCR